MTQDLNSSASSNALTDELRQFAGGLAHAIANVFSSLQMNAELSRMYARRNDVERASVPLDRLIEDCSRANKIIADLQRLASAISMKSVARMPLQNAVRVAMDTARGRHDESSIHDIDLHLIGDEAQVDSNSQIVLTELFLNALQYGSNKLVVSTDVSPTHAKITVEDNGNGIDTAALGRIFEPFHTTHREKGRSGLGLTIARHLSTRLGGTLTVRATDGQGTTAEVILPRLDPAG